MNTLVRGLRDDRSARRSYANHWCDRGREQIPNFAHVTNQDDPVPNVPPHFLDFEHPGGELHITAVDNSTGQATMVNCPGSENQVSVARRSVLQRILIVSRAHQNCAAGNSLLDTSIPNHLGPYFNGISFGGKACTS